MQEIVVNRVRVKVINGDISLAKADSIINAANRFLKHGGGVALALVRRGGHEIQRESDEFIKRHGPLGRGEVAVTTAGRLFAKRIIHVAGPIYGEGTFEDLVGAYMAALKTAEEHGDSVVAIPAISSGAYGFPIEDSARALFQALKSISTKSLKEVDVYILDKKQAKSFEDALIATAGLD